MSKNIGFLGGINQRTLCYLKEFKKNAIKMKSIILYGTSYNEVLLRKILYLYNEIIVIKSINSSNIKIKKCFDGLSLDYVVYSGNPGEILNIEMFKTLKLNFLHSHTGKLPKFKGSTTIYYSILILGKIYCSTFIMSKEIDNGALLLVKKYKIPKVINSIESTYDNKIRAVNLVKFLNSKKKVNQLKGKKSLSYLSDYYFIAHPLIRSFAIKRLKRAVKKRPNKI